MENYLINTNTDKNGNHEIHRTFICQNLPSIQNRKNLGWFSSASAALKYAKTNGYPNADGCYFCCREIHHG